MSKKALTTAIGFLLLSGISGWSHRLIIADTQPDSRGTAIQIEKPAVSQVYYDAWNRAKPETWFAFRGKEGDRVVIALGVPVISRLQSFRPKLALVGPGFPAVQLPFSAPVSTGKVFSPASSPVIFHEPVTGTDSWWLVQEEITLPASGEFFLVAFSQGELPADPKLWMSIGYLERFSLGDIFSIFRWRRIVRRFHEVKS